MDEKFILKYFYFNRVAHAAYDWLSKLKKNIYFNSIPLCKGEAFNPFFIVGSGRSGNTLLRRILNASEGIIIPPETYVLGKVIRLHKAHKNLEWDDYINLIISTFEYHSQFYTFEIESLSDLALELKKTKKEERSLAYVIDCYFKFYSIKKNIDLIRWGDKTPANSMYVYRIKKLFPNAQFIHIIRDGIDVIHSYKKAGIYKDYHTAALRWKGSVNFLHKFGEKYSSNYYEIKYEDLVSDPKREVQEICRFLNINFHEKMLNLSKNVNALGDVKYLKHHKNIYMKINTKNIGKGRKNISQYIDQEIASTINSTLEKFGYEKV